MDCGRVLRCVLSAIMIIAGLAVVGATSVGAATAPQLTRYPYLTDAVGTSMTVNWATDRSSKAGTVQWGATDGNGNCNPTNPVAGTWYPITVNTVSEYQWTATLSLPAPGTYCYRPFLASTDLLGSDPSPTFATQVPAGSAQSFSFDVFGDWGQTDANGNNAAPDEPDDVRSPRAAHSSR